MNPLKELKTLGQSVWYDNIRRSLITSGELGRMMEEYAVTGLTSNPTIFEKAISGGTEYDEDIARLAREGVGAEDILKDLVVKDIRLAARALLPVYKSSSGEDGYVSVEVDPGFARDAGRTVAEARELFRRIGMPNIMVKVPGTVEGLSAIEELTYEGCNINVTLLFSVDRYGEVARAYTRALERRAKEGKPVSSIFSVASFFVSRVDTLVDRLVEERLKGASSGEKARLRELAGRLAVSNAKLAYMEYRVVFEGEEFGALRRAGARQQKLLWGSTSTKNPLFSDVKYVEELIWKGTINTMPLQTLHAFHDHGRAAPTLGEGLDEAKRTIEGLPSLGISLVDVTRELEAEGVRAFADSYRDLKKCIAEKREAVMAEKGPAVSFSLAGFEGLVSGEMKEIEKERFLERLLEKDPLLWKKAPGEKRQIKNSLGWLALPEEMEDCVDELKGFAWEVKEEGFRDAVLLGMGGSSLAPLVMGETFGARQGYLRLRVLDSTDPGAVRAISRGVGEKTLFIVSSKSGTTLEPLSFFEYFYEKMRGIKGERAGENFVAITDPGTPLEGFAKKYSFRRVFLNPPDVGGRYSALSLFGLVPAALSGIDISKLLYYARRVQAAVDPSTSVEGNLTIKLGVVLGVLAREGRDKVTLVLSKEVSSFGLWIEQLLAESTGKEGKGVVPVTGEPLGGLRDYSDDRVFVFITLGRDSGSRASARRLSSRHPVVEISLEDPHELGGEFFRWEVATAVCGHVLGINPFDQPDVELTKKLTMERLRKGSLEPPGVTVEEKGLKVSFGHKTFKKLKGRGDGIEGTLRGFFSLLGKGDYVGLLAYLNPYGKPLEGVFRDLQEAIMKSRKAAVEFGFGPRYLHSTGQLHKGGHDEGVFVIFACEKGSEVEIPGRQFGFRELLLSQAFGDAEALDERGRRVALFVLRDSSKKSLERACSIVKRSLI